MSFYIARNRHPKSALNLFRHGHTGPSRLRLKKKDQKQDPTLCKDNPYIFHPRVRTVEPVQQVLRNTKSVINVGLPSVVLSGVDDFSFGNILPQIKHCVVSSSTCEDGQNVKSAQRSKGVIMNVVKAVWSFADRYPGLLRQTISYKPYLKASWSRFGYNFQVSGRTGLLFSSELALPNFAPSIEISKTIGMSCEDKDELISPIFELSQNVSRKGFDSGFYSDVFPHPQTLIITEPNWKLPHLVAQGIMFSFGQLIQNAVCEGVALFGNSLPNPVSIRCIVYNDQKMALLCYQLNTLDFDSDEGIKNQVWLSPEFPICFTEGVAVQSKNLPDKNTETLKFPENEFKELVALLLYGQGLCDNVELQQSSVI